MSGCAAASTAMCSLSLDIKHEQQSGKQHAHTKKKKERRKKEKINKYHILDKKLHEKSAKVIMLDVWAGFISTRSLPYLWSFELLPFIRLLFALLNALLLENNISEA